MPSLIQIPARATVTEVSQVIRACTKLERIREPATMDCTQTTMFGPMGIALLAASARVRNSRGFKTDLKLPEDEGAKDFVGEIGLGRFVDGEATGIGTLEVRAMDSLDALYTEALTVELGSGIG